MRFPRDIMMTLDVTTTTNSNNNTENPDGYPDVPALDETTPILTLLGVCFLLLMAYSLIVCFLDCARDHYERVERRIVAELTVFLFLSIGAILFYGLARSVLQGPDGLAYLRAFWTVCFLLAAGATVAAVRLAWTCVADYAADRRELRAWVDEDTPLVAVEAPLDASW